MKKKDEEVIESEESKVCDEKDVVLYDFNPIAKGNERIERKDGVVSFDPAFIEEDVKLDLHIPQTSIVAEKKELVPEKKEEIKEPLVKKEVPSKELVVPSKTEPVLSPITVSTPLKPIYLEDTSLRPPKEVPSIVVPETRLKNEEPVKDVIMIEKKQKGEPRLFIKVDEAPPIKEEQKKEDEKAKVTPVNEVNDVKKKPIETQPIPEKVQEASQIKEPSQEEKKEEIADVGEVDVPKHEEKEKDVVLPSVMEIPQIAYAPDEEKEVIAPVSTVSIPQKPEEKNEEDKEEPQNVEDVKEEIEHVEEKEETIEKKRVG